MPSEPTPKCCSSLEMAARFDQGAAQTQLGGFDCEFVERPPDAIQADCPICRCVLSEPHQVTCCGYNYCQSCIERVQLQKSPCPTCNGTDFSVFSNQGLKRSLYAFKVQCSHKKEGCQWTGELRELDKHLNENAKLQEQLIGCEFTRVRCHHCFEDYQRRYVTAHQTNECIRRQYKCPFCDNYEADYKDVTTKHWPVCGFYRVSCPYQCGKEPERQNLERHVSKDCHLAVVNCNFHYAGCVVQLRRKDMSAHLAENVVDHMSLMAVQNQKKDGEITRLKAELAESRSHMAEWNQTRFAKEKEEITRLKNELAVRMGEIVKLEEVHERKIEALERETEELRRRLAQQTREVEPILPSLPVEFTMANFEEHKQNKEIWYSPPFYTHPRGYKMCLRVNPDGPSSACIAVSVRLMRGEFDHLLKWPFDHSIAFELVNQLQDSGHYRLTATFVGARRACRMSDGDRAEEGDGGCVPYDKLNYDVANRCEYLKENCLRIRVSHVVNRDLLQFQRQCIDSRFCHCPIELTMTDFKRFKQEHDRWFSPSFYTHARGYIICVEVCACDSAHNTHIGVYVHLMQGKYDHLVEWPFRGDITIHLLNRLRDKGHHEKTVPFTDETPDEQAGKVTRWVMNKGRGYSEFIPYDELDLNLDTNSQYLGNDDCLRFRVTAKVK